MGSDGAHLSVKNLLDSIEKWASESAERVQLVMLLTCLTLAFLVLAGVAVIALVMLPREMLPF
jgi:hypothetical protein